MTVFLLPTLSDQAVVRLRQLRSMVIPMLISQKDQSGIGSNDNSILSTNLRLPKVGTVVPCS
jgi:hypothetical protein